MPQDIAQAARVQGRFHNQIAQRQRAAPAALQRRPGPLHIRNRHDCVVAGLLLSAALSQLHLRNGASTPLRAHTVHNAGNRGVQQVQPAAQWPPGAHALAIPMGMDWMGGLAELLGTQISAEQAALELDIDAIAGATRAAQAQPGSIVARREATNRARLDTIAQQFEREGHAVERQPFNLTTHTLFSHPYRTSGQNLRVTLCGRGPVQRTLMVLAHGDVAGAELGSTGSLDNGVGVGVLLALARHLEHTGLPDGARVQLLVTDKEEAGLKGAKAYVRDCQAATDCPDVALNLNILGYGDGISVSGSADHARFGDGDSRFANGTATVTPAEAQLERLLRNAAAEVGMQVHATPGWTLQSDHVAFQRAGLAALGLSGMVEADIAPERAMQMARARYLQAEARVTPRRYDAYMAGSLNQTEALAMQRDIQASDNAALEYQALPQSQRQRRIHTAADQPEHVDIRQALATLDVVRRTVDAWLALPSSHAHFYADSDVPA